MPVERRSGAIGRYTPAMVRQPQVPAREPCAQSVRGVAWIVVACVLACLAVAPGCSEHEASYVVSVEANAGSDQTARAGTTVTLDGSRSSLSPLAYWTGDGDSGDEDQLVMYDSRTGTSTRTLRDALNNPLGWPGDIVLAGDEIVGADTATSRIVSIDLECGCFRYLTPTFEHRHLTGLAYDGRSRRLLVADAAGRELLSVDLQTGGASKLCRLEALEQLTGVAYADGSGDVYVSDRTTRAIYRVDPHVGSAERIIALEGHDEAFIDEVAWFRGEIYCTVSHGTEEDSVVQLHRFDRSAGRLVPIAGPIHADGHLLVMRSVPETVTWKLVEGPDAVEIVDEHALKTEVKLGQAGVYTFRLAIAGATEQGATVKVVVHAD